MYFTHTKPCHKVTLKEFSPSISSFSHTDCSYPQIEEEMPQEITKPLTPPSPLETFDIDHVLSKLSTAEKIDLLSGKKVTLKSYRQGKLI
jgi:hypothetical protein